VAAKAVSRGLVAAHPDRGAAVDVQLERLDEL
jgi:hypothetical protein